MEPILFETNHGEFKPKSALKYTDFGWETNKRRQVGSFQEPWEVIAIKNHLKEPEKTKEHEIPQ